MARRAFFGLLLGIGALGLYLEFRAPLAPDPMLRALAGTSGDVVHGRELTAALESVNELAEKDSGQARVTPVVPTQASESLFARLKAMPMDQAISRATSLISGDSAVPVSDRLDAISFLRVHEQDQPGEINSAVVRELAPERLAQLRMSGDEASTYIDFLTHVFVETSSDPAGALNELLPVLDGDQDPLHRKALVNAYVDAVPEQRQAVAQALQQRGLETRELIDEPMSHGPPQPE